MVTRLARALVTTGLVAGSMTGLAVAASAAVGPGTFTKITTPSGTTTFVYKDAGPNSVTVSGQASADLNGSTVDIDCILLVPSGDSGGPVQVETFASAVPVSNGAFSTIATVAKFTPNCRLRAVPSSLDPTTDYVGSFAGPIFYTDMLSVTKASSVPVKFTAIGEQADGVGETQDAAQCGIALVATIQTPQMELVGPENPQCAFALPSGNVTSGSASTASPIRVDGHNAYLPESVDSFLNNEQTLGVTQSKLTTTFTRSADGDVTVTESAPLMRCSGDNTYPPTPLSCPSLIGTGVKFTRVTGIVRDAHEVRLRDIFTSTDGHQHTVKAQYQAEAAGTTSGLPGFSFPGHAGGFVTTTPDQIITNLGSKAATVFIRSDIYAVEGDPAADTVGLSWSRPPSQIQFAHGSANLFAMPCSLTVAAGGNGYLGFAETQAPLTSTTKTRAGVAIGEMVSTPVISSPTAGATIQGTSTTVKGSVALGANGLPKSVSVNGHTAHLSINSSKTKLNYTVTFNESLGKHTIKATAADAVGNASTKSITVRNV
jgi:hypothetical protein